MALVTINTFDLSPYIITPSYEMNKEDVYNEWVDGNGITHRNVYRTRITGEFSVKFWNRSAYASFLTALGGVKTSGYYPMTVYINNTQTTEAANLFVEFGPALTAQYTAGNEYERFRIRVEER